MISTENVGYSLTGVATFLGPYESDGERSVADTIEKTCRVRFFELRVLPDEKAIPGQRWSSIIRGLLGSSNCGRPGAHECEYNGVAIEGMPLLEAGSPMAALAVDRAITPRQRNVITSQRSDLPVDQDHEPVEETFVSFFPNNVVGLVLSTISAPSHAAVAAWLNAVAPPTSEGPDAKWHAVPIVDPEKYRVIEDAAEATSVTFALKPDNIPGGYEPLLGGFLSEGQQYGHGVRIEVKVTAGRGRPGESSRDAAKRLARGLVGMHDAGVDLEKAQANIRRVYGEAVEPIDILHHRLAREVKIPVTTGRSLDQAAVFRETRAAYQAMQEEILGAIGLS
ncbi:hypothetical protein [Gordonia jacobaea]|uniref:hypothetical protein n=1 Tax=Gordonia jacobaea TaxID=122202 RepID=UPI0022E6D31E|nr:hypothetical protein [Gordonia jacobaea]